MAKVRLYEITALISRTVVVAAVSEEDAMKHVESWENAWESSSDLIGVSDVDLDHVRDVAATDIDDEAHEVTIAAKAVLKRKAKKGEHGDD